MCRQNQLPRTSDILLKYNLLDAIAQQEVIDFMDFLLTKRKKQDWSRTYYQQQLLTVSVWTAEDIAVWEDTQSLWNQWTIDKSHYP